MKTLAEKIEIMQACLDGKTIESMFANGDYWCPITNPKFNWENCDYRVKVIKPSIDWSHVSDKYKYMATDYDGTTWLYSAKPNFEHGHWGYFIGAEEIERVTYLQANNFSSFESGDCNPEDSLVERGE